MLNLISATFLSIDWLTLICGTIIAMMINYRLCEAVANRGKGNLPVSEIIATVAIVAMAARELAYSLDKIRGPFRVGGVEATLSLALGTLLFISLILIYNSGVYGRNAEVRRQRRQANALLRVQELRNLQDKETFFLNLEESVRNAETGNYLLTADGKLHPTK